MLPIIVGSIVWLTLGLVISIPYCVLAGPSLEAFSMCTLYMPAVAFIWLIAADLAGVISFDSLRYKNFPSFRPMKAFTKCSNRSAGTLQFFWIVTIYITLPIILNAISMALGGWGQEEIADILYIHRYRSLVYAFAIAWVAVCVKGFVDKLNLKLSTE